MKKEYNFPEFELVKFNLDSILIDITHSDPEGFTWGGEEGPDE